MRKNKLPHVLEPGLRLYFLFLVIFAAVSAFFNVYLAVVEGVVVLLLFFYFRASTAQRRKVRSRASSAARTPGGSKGRQGAGQCQMIPSMETHTSPA